MRKIKVLVVDDSRLFRELLVEALRRDASIEVVGAAKDAQEARAMIEKYNPDVMTLDIEMPGMDGIELLKLVMNEHPMPVVMVSALSDKVFDAMNAGAVEFICKPDGTDAKGLQDFVDTEMRVKVKVASVARVNKGPAAPIPRRVSSSPSKSKCELIAIGASTGGTEATAALMQSFGPDYPPTVIVQHMPAGFTTLYANRLNDRSGMEVREAKTGDVLRQGLALLAPGGDQHMEIIKQDGQYKVILKNKDKVNGHRPSVDVLFKSVAKEAKDKSIGIILTGMGGDGANGLLEMRQKGARTIGQDESTCVVYGMPKVAFDIGAVEFQEKLPNISARVQSLLGV